MCGAVAAVAGGSAGAAFPAGSTAAARSAASGLSVAVTASVSAFGSGDSDPAGASCMCTSVTILLPLQTDGAAAAPYMFIPGFPAAASHRLERIGGNPPPAPLDE
jgi:hypothetical protein